MPIELPNVASFVSRASQECGFDRERFDDSKVPDDFNKIVVVLFLGDYRSYSILSSLVFRSYRSEVLRGKYVIFCGMPGMGGLFPVADEYWSVSDALSMNDLMVNSSGFFNYSKKFDSMAMQLRRRFTATLTGEDFLPYYDRGITPYYLERFGSVKRFFPSVPAWRGGEIDIWRGKKGVFVYPNLLGKCWNRNGEISLDLSKEFWVKLTERLLESGLTPVVYQNQGSHDLSQHFGERCVYCTDRNFSNVLGAMRTTGCVLDVFSGISRMSVLARCPFMALDERQRYVNSKEFEINDLCVGGSFPYKYVFSFPTVADSSRSELINQIVNTLGGFLPEVSGASLPPAAESLEEVPYDVVREHKAKKLGIHFIRVERLVIE